jgi:hypothetical protein
MMLAWLIVFGTAFTLVLAHTLLSAPDYSKVEPTEPEELAEHQQCLHQAGEHPEPTCRH